MTRGVCLTWFALAALLFSVSGCEKSASRRAAHT